MAEPDITPRASDGAPIRARGTGELAVGAADGHAVGIADDVAAPPPGGAVPRAIDATAPPPTGTVPRADDAAPPSDGPQLPAPPPPNELLPEETVDGVPVLAEVRALTAAPVSLPAVQAAAAAATGFVAGAATLALVRRHSARRLARRRQRQRPPGRPGDALPIIASRSFLVDVHLIAKPGE